MSVGVGPKDTELVKTGFYVKISDNLGLACTMQPIFGQLLVMGISLA